MKGTRIEIIALTEKGRKSLALQKADEIKLRAEWKDVRKWKIPFNVRNYLKTVSLFMPKDGDPQRHEILGFKRMGQVSKNQFYLGVKKSFLENGCSVEDFEVRFIDE